MERVRVKVWPVLVLPSGPTVDVVVGSKTTSVYVPSARAERLKNLNRFITCFGSEGLPTTVISRV